MKTAEENNNQPKILIVDDDQNHLRTIDKLLTKLEVQIYQANSGSEALSLLLRHDFMLILLDVKMSGMDGFETAQLIRQNKNCMHIPIIFMTAYDKDEVEINEGYKLGAIDYLFKPVNSDILLCKVDIFLRFLNSKKERLIKEKEREKEKMYKEWVSHLEEKNKELRKSQLAALNMMEGANEAKEASQKSELMIKQQAKDLEQFAYTATHDLKAPISNIESYLTFLKEDKSITDEDSLASIDWIEKSVDRCKTLIENLVTVVQVKDESNFDLSFIKLEDIFQNTLEAVQTKIKEAKASIKSDFTKVDSIFYSKPHMESLMLNLIDNAIKYKSKDRDLIIKVYTWENEDYHCLSVQDNGIGINVKRDKDKVFGLFKRAVKNVEGSGMGLYLINQTLQKMEGKIEIESEENIGSTFTAYFKNE